MAPQGRVFAVGSDWENNTFFIIADFTGISHYACQGVAQVVFGLGINGRDIPAFTFGEHLCIIENNIGNAGQCRIGGDKGV